MSGERDNVAFQSEINTFYSNKEAFLCELINNSSDFLDEIRSESLIDKSKLDAQPRLFVRIVPVEVNKTLFVIDRGVKMTKGVLGNHLGIVRSGSKELMRALHAGGDVSMIVKIEVELYSAYLVAERGVMTTKHIDDVQYIWESQAGGSFTVTRDINVRDTKIILSLKEDQTCARRQCSIRKFADAAPLPDPPVIVGFSDEENSDDSSFLKEKISPDVAEGPGEVEEDEEVESQRAETNRKLLEEKVIPIYEQQAGEVGLILISKFNLCDVEGYYTLSKRVKYSYPGGHEAIDYEDVPHVLWPWWSLYQDISYRGGGGESLDPLSITWDEFASKLDHAVVHWRQNDTEVVVLRKFGNRPVELDIPKSSITSKPRLNLIINFYSSAYRGYEPYDDAIPPLDPWDAHHILSYKDDNFQPLHWREEPYREPWELRLNEEMIRSLNAFMNGEEPGEPEDRGGEVVEGDAVEEQSNDDEERVEEQIEEMGEEQSEEMVEEESEDRNEEEIKDWDNEEETEESEEETQDWDAFIHKLKYIDVEPVGWKLKQDQEKEQEKEQ